MAKPVTQKIKLVSSAGTGYYYVTKKIRAIRPRSSYSRNTIRSRASTSNSRKPRSNSWNGAGLAEALRCAAGCGIVIV